MKYLKSLLYSIFKSTLVIKLKLMIFLLICTSSFSSSAFDKALDNQLEEALKGKWELSKRQINILKQGKVLSEADVQKHNKQQVFKMKAIGFHQKKCSKVLRKISMFENYKDWISFVKSSHYNERSKLLTIRADHMLLPYPMIVHIIIPRPKKPGKYKFLFPTGMFTGLTGEFEIKEIRNRCFLFSESYWKGKSTKLPNFVIELFSETLSKIGGEVLMRKTR